MPKIQTHTHTHTHTHISIAIHYLLAKTTAQAIPINPTIGAHDGHT